MRYVIAHIDDNGYLPDQVRRLERPSLAELTSQPDDR